MDKELISDYLQRTGMKDAQADALARILDEMATRDALTVLEHKIDGKLEALKADLTWRMIAMTIFLATVMTLLNLFV